MVSVSLRDLYMLELRKRQHQEVTQAVRDALYPFGPSYAEIVYDPDFNRVRVFLSIFPKDRALEFDRDVLIDKNPENPVAYLGWLIAKHIRNIREPIPDNIVLGEN